jgi:hypothetical protein
VTGDASVALPATATPAPDRLVWLTVGVALLAAGFTLVRRRRRTALPTE